MVSSHVHMYECVHAIMKQCQAYGKALEPHEHFVHTFASV